MRKETVFWAVLLCSMTVLAHGCAYMEDLQNFTQEESREYQPETSGESGTETGTERVSEPQNEETLNTQAVSGLYYAYHCLDEQRQKIYLEMYDALSNMKNDVYLSTVDKSVLDEVFACVMNDHPELFYVEGYQYTEYTFGGTPTSITFSGTYSMTSEEAEQTRQRIEQQLEECFRQVPLNEDEYSTVKFLYEWLINHTEYDKNAENNQNICSVFLEGRSVCQGYAKAMQYMLQKADIQCMIVTGFTNGERHAWNLVRVNGAYYYLDPTWGDASYASSEMQDSSDGSAPAINYDYFLVTTDEITRTHSIEKVVELPQCTDIQDNYFVREGLYFESYDEQQLALIFESQSAGYVTLKCSNSECYAQMIQNLIDAQKIFNFIGGQSSSIAYTSNEEQRTISFWNL